MKLRFCWLARVVREFWSQIEKAWNRGNQAVIIQNVYYTGHGAEDSTPALPSRWGAVLLLGLWHSVGSEGVRLGAEERCAWFGQLFPSWSPPPCLELPTPPPPLAWMEHACFGQLNHFPAWASTNCNINISSDITREPLPKAIWSLFLAVATLLIRSQLLVPSRWASCRCFPQG